MFLIENDFDVSDEEIAVIFKRIGLFRNLVNTSISYSEFLLFLKQKNVLNSVKST